MTTTIQLFGDNDKMRISTNNLLGEQIAETLKNVLENGNPNEILKYLQEKEQELGVFFR